MPQQRGEGPGAVFGPSEPAIIPPQVRTIGVPRGRLPFVSIVVQRLKELVRDHGVTVEETVWDQLPQRLLSNYPYMVPGAGESVSGERGNGGSLSGLLVPLGPVEALVTLDPQSPLVVAAPAGSHDGPPAQGRPDTRLPTIPEEHEATTASAEPPLLSGTQDAAGGPAGAGRGERGGPQPLLGPRGSDPEARRATGTVNAVYATGAHTQTRSGSMGFTRGGLSLSGWIGLTSGTLNVLKVGAGISGTANAVSRSTTRVVDAEGGHVEDNRAPSADAEGGHVQDNRGPFALLAYRADWSVRLRTDGARKWEDIPPVTVKTSGEERLMLYVPEHYLRAPGPQITATGTGGLHHRLPATYFASGLTNLPVLMDAVVEQLQAQGLSLPVGSAIRDELHDKLWNLGAHLDEAVNDRHGYQFDLSRLATVHIHSVRASRGTSVGAATDSAYLENVRTAINGTGGTHTVSQSTDLKLLSAQLDLLPVHLREPALNLGVGLSLGVTWSHSDTVSASRTGLWVVVPRYSGFTSAYDLEFSHSAVVSVVGRPPVRIASVSGRCLVRVPEPDAFKHGFPVDENALSGAVTASRAPGQGPVSGRAAAASGTRKPASPGRAIAYAPDLVRRAGRRPGDPAYRAAPAYVNEGKGVGMGLVEVDPGTARAVYEALESELAGRGFVSGDPDGPLSDAHWYSHANARDSRMENVELLRKLVSVRSFEAHYDQIHQTGLTFTLYQRRGALGVDVDLDAARITIKAAKAVRATEYEGSTDTRHVVNLAMGMGTAGQAVAGATRLSAGFRSRVLFNQLKGSGHGFDLFRQVGASQGVNLLHNRPELLEYAGVVDRHRLFSDYTVTVEYQHSGLQGKIRQGIRNPPPTVLRNEPALAYLPPLGDASDPGVTSLTRTPPSVLKHAVIHYLDASGLHEAAVRALAPLTGPQGNADQELKAATSTIEIRAYAKEIFNVSDGGEGTDGAGSADYTTDQFFDPGLWRDTVAGLDISGRMGPARFAGATDSPFVIGTIQLAMGQTSAADTSSFGVRVVGVDETVGGPVDSGHEGGTGFLQGGVDGSVTRQRNTTKGGVRSAAKEDIQLDINRAYAFLTSADLLVRGRLEKHGKFARSAYASDQQLVGGRTMLFVLSEPTALEEYGKGNLPVSDRQLADAMNRWANGEVRLSGDTVAAVLTRWVEDAPELRGDLPERLGAERASLTGMLAALHADGALTVGNSGVRAAFNERFGLSLDAPADRYAQIALPEYLTRDDPGGRTLGHSGVHDLTHADGRTTVEIIREQLEKSAPGLLASRPDVWMGRGRRIGRLQGGVDSLQTILAQGRDLAWWDDLLSPNGRSLYFVNPMGWLFADVVEVNLSSVLTSAPRITDFRPGTGLENYSHGYVSTSKNASRDATQAFTIARLGGGETHTYEGATLGLGSGHHRGVTRTAVGVTEQTVYDWTGHYRVRYEQTFTVKVRRLDMAGRPLNNFAVHLYRGLDKDRSATHTSSVKGTLETQVPRGLAELEAGIGPRRPHGLRPLPSLPGDAAVVGTMLDDALPAARKLLQEMFGPKADGTTTRTATTIGELFSRTQMTNHITEAVAGNSYLLTDTLFIPGHSAKRARMWLKGDLFDLHVVGPVKGTGTGRYAKHQDGTTHEAGSSRWRPTATAGASASGVLHAPAPAGGQDQAPPPYRTGSDTTASRATEASVAGASTENYRREQHVKQQGPVYLVRMRGRFRLHAQRYDRHLFGPDTVKSSHRSEAFAGDVYAEVFQSDVDRLKATLAEAESPHVAPPDLDWLGLDHAPRFDLSTLLADAAAGLAPDAQRAHELVARGVHRTHAGPLDHAVLTFDTAAWDGRAITETLRWAAHTLRADLEQARKNDPTFPEAAALTRYERYLADLPALPGELLVHRAADTVGAVVLDVNAVHGQITGKADLPPVQLPGIAAFHALDRQALMRNIAHELDARLRVDFLLPNGEREYSRWVEPSGRIHAFDPLDPFGPGARSLTSVQAEAARLLTSEVRRAADRIGLGDQELGGLYGASVRGQTDFTAVLRDETDRRRVGLTALDACLPDLLDAAFETAGARAPAAESADAEVAEEVLDTLQRLARTAPADPGGRLPALSRAVDAVLDLSAPCAYSSVSAAARNENTAPSEAADAHAAARPGDTASYARTAQLRCPDASPPAAGVTAIDPTMSAPDSPMASRRPPPPPATRPAITRSA